MMSPWQATFLGVVEGLTEFLPVSSTGHLILAAHALHLEGEAAKTFEVVIQAGALAAVVVLYRRRAAAMWRGVTGGDLFGRQLVVNLLVSFMPAAVVGLLLHKVIKATLFAMWPVIAALALGGVVMILVDLGLRRRPERSARMLESLSMSDAFLIGCAQCLALWPGTSRSMVTILAGLLCGLSGAAAAEYSFLLAVPTLGAATVFDALKGGHELLQQIGAFSLLCGFLASGIVAALAIRGFIHYLSRRGLAPFGWYRIALAVLVWAMTIWHRL